MLAPFPNRAATWHSPPGPRIVESISTKRTNSEYDKFAIVAPKACTVIVHDLNDTAHQLEVTAETLYEAVAQALAMVSGHDWVGDIGRGLTTVTVKVRNPEITHIVKVQDFENWLNRGCNSPADTVLKTRLREMLWESANNNKEIQWDRPEICGGS